MNCLFSGAITRIGGAQKCAGGVASVKYSMFRLGLFILGVSALFICPYPGLSCLLYSGILARTYSRSPQYGVPTRYHSLARFISILVFTH